MKLSGSDIFVECLRKEKVEVLFGYPGGVVIPIFDKLYDAKDIRFILTRHEQAAAHAADGYARATGKVGCVATRPRRNQLVTKSPPMDPIPMQAFTGRCPCRSWHECAPGSHITGITRPITSIFPVSDTSKLADIISEAFYIAARPPDQCLSISKM